MIEILERCIYCFWGELREPKKIADWKKIMQGHRGHRRVKWELDQGLKVKVQVYSLISSLKTYHPTLHFTPVRPCAISTTRRVYSPAAVSVH